MAGAEQAFRDASQAVVDLVFTDDFELFDSLHDEVQADLGPPLAELLEPLRSGSRLDDLLFAARIVGELADDYRRALPPELAAAIDDMVTARTTLIEQTGRKK